jgi:Protein of unknown function (DUF1254)
VARPPTPWVWVLGRTLVDGAADVANVQAVQAQYRLTPLSLWGKPGAVVPERRDVYKPAEVAADPLGPCPVRVASTYPRVGSVAVSPHWDDDAAHITC